MKLTNIIKIVCILSYLYINNRKKINKISLVSTIVTYLCMIIINKCISRKSIHKFVKNLIIYKRFCKFVYLLNKNFLDKKYKEMFQARFDNKSDSMYEMILYKFSERFIIDHEENEYIETRHEFRSLFIDGIVFLFKCLRIWYNRLDKIIWEFL